MTPPVIKSSDQPQPSPIGLLLLNLTFRDRLQLADR
jgi:hypothetical protein